MERLDIAENFTLYCGDAIEALRSLPEGSLDCCITSPPYFGLRDYGVSGQIGLEQTPDEYVSKLVEVFKEVRRVLCEAGTLWLNIGDTYYSTTKGSGGRSAKQSSNAGSRFKQRRFKCPGLKPKDLIMIPAMLALALRADGWYLRSEIVWSKPNPMPESVTDRPTTAHEKIFLLSKSPRYYYDANAIAEPANFNGKSGNKNYRPDAPNGRIAGDAMNSGGARTKRNRRNVWSFVPGHFKGAHFAVFPPELPRLCMLAGCPVGGTVIDVFSGAGTTGLVAVQSGRAFVGIEVNPAYCDLTRTRYAAEGPRPQANLDSLFEADDAA